MNWEIGYYTYDIRHTITLDLSDNEEPMLSYEDCLRAMGLKENSSYAATLDIVLITQWQPNPYTFDDMAVEYILVKDMFMLIQYIDTPEAHKFERWIRETILEGEDIVAK